MIGILHLPVQIAEDAATDDGDNDIEEDEKEDAGEHEFLAQVDFGLPGYNNGEGDDCNWRE